jgi:citrate lyase subunit beta/citryl-CoA lyase
MSTDLDAVRSVYFVPGTNADGISQGLASGADALCADLEDLVPADAKAEARRIVRELFSSAGEGAPILLLRINPPDSEHFADDEKLLTELPLGGLFLPLASASSLGAVSHYGLPIVAMIETAAGVRSAFEIASLPAAARMTLGPGDLGKQLHLDVRGEPDALLHVRSTLVIDSGAAGIEGPFDTPGVGEDESFRTAVRYGRALGFRGKLCFTPAQVAIVNEEYRQV